jgi:hypothetical protein
VNCGKRKREKNGILEWKEESWNVDATVGEDS